VVLAAPRLSPWCRSFDLGHEFTVGGAGDGEVLITVFQLQTQVPDSCWSVVIC